MTDESPVKKRKTDDNDDDEHSPKTPQNDNNINISFKVTPTTKLKNSIESLTDTSFNPKCRGLLDVSHQGFKITARNTDTGVAANLFLDSSELINFSCNKPIVGKIIHLYDISQFLLNVVVVDRNDNDNDNDDTAVITVLHLDGSTTLSFQCGHFLQGSDASTELKVELLETNDADEIEKFPDVEFFCEAVLSSEVLRELIDHIQKEAERSRADYPLKGEEQLVSVDLSEGLVTIFVGLLNSWQYRFIETYSKNKKDYKGMAPGQKHHAWIQIRHLIAIRKASFVAPHLLIKYLTEPSKNVVMQFSLGELGCLTFIIKAIKVTTNSDEIQKGDVTTTIDLNRSL